MTTFPLLLCCAALALTKAAVQEAASQGPEKDAPSKLELAGTLLDAEGKPFRGVTPIAFLYGATSPFTARTAIGPDGKFKFKGLKPALYTLAAAVPRVGEMRQTVNVSPSQTDRKGRVSVTMVWNEAAAERAPTRIAASQLSVPDRALQEFANAEERLGRRDVAGAEAALKRAVQIAPRFSSAWNQLGVLCYQTQRYAEAEAHFREALAQDPASYMPLVNLGGALISLQRNEESLEVNLRAARERPDDPLAYSQLGSSYAALGQLDKAEEALKRAIALEPGHFSMPHLKLAQVYGQKKNVAEAIRQLGEFIKFHPDAPQAPGIRRLLDANSIRIKPSP